MMCRTESSKRRGRAGSGSAHPRQAPQPRPARARSGLRLVLQVFGLGLVTLVTPAMGQDGGVRSLFATGSGLRGLSMGGAQTGLAHDALALDWNPAGLGRAQRAEFAFGRSSYFGETIDETQFHSVLPSWRWGGLGVGVRHFGVDGIEGRDSRNQLTEENLGASAMQFAAGYGRSLGAWSLGGTVKVQREQVAGTGASGIGLDLGMQVDVSEAFDVAPDWMEGLSAGVVWVNAVEPSLRLEEDTVVDPAALRAGLALTSLRIAGANLVAAVDLEHSRPTGSEVHAGIELLIHSALALRSGIGEHGPAAGAGVRWNELQLDYVLQATELGSVHRAGVSWNFGGTTEERRLAYVARQETELQDRLEQASARREAERIDDLRSGAESLRRAGRILDAIAQIEVAQILAPERQDLIDLEVLCWMERGQELEAHGDLTDATLAYAHVLSLVPGHEGAALAQERTQAESAQRAQRDARVRARFTEALDAFGKGDLLTARESFASITKDHEDAEAEAMLARTEQAIQTTAAAHLDQSRGFMTQGLFEAAERELREARRLTPDSQSLAAAERDLAQRRRVDAGSRLSTGASRPDEPTQDGRGTTNNLVARGSAGTSAAAAPRTPAAPAMDPAEVADLYRRGIEASQAARSEDAVRYFELVHSAAPEHGQVRENLVREYLAVGMERFAKGDLDQAIDVWQRALAVDPSDERTRGYLERALRHQSRSREILGSSQR